MDDLLADFLAETAESLGELDDALLRLERAPQDRETLSLIFRLVHTIKGTCGFLSLARLERVAHAAEDVLGRVRDGLVAVSPELVTLILAALERIKRIVAGIAEHGTEPDGDDAPLIADLNSAAEGKPAAPSPLAPQEPEAGDGGPAGPQTIRVNVDVLENLMVLVSELVLTRNQLLQLVRRDSATPLSTPLQRLSLITTEIQEGVMKARMQPISHAWNKMPRLVRDLARDLGKKIELVMHGAETELDRQVLELIKDPLTHMVRNSVDHGLESPADRRAAGKPETGRITLNAFHEGGHVMIEIADDGRGLAVESIRAKARARHLVPEGELAAMSDEQVQRFIFSPGFSTAASITAVSGRGVGMDVVKTNVEKVGGSIDIRSKVGAGATFTIKIPLTLAIVSALIVEAGGERFAFPQTTVVELVKAGGSADGAVEHISATPVLRLRDRILPLVELAALLELRPAASGEGGSFIVVVQVGAAMLGIAVDRVFDTEEIVVKPLSPLLRHIGVFGGNTVLGDGSVITILDPNGIARASGLADADMRLADTRGGEPSDTGDKAALLLFRAGGKQPLAVPLGVITRLEDIERERIEGVPGRLVTQYRGTLMPLIPLAGFDEDAAAKIPMLVVSDGSRRVGLMVDEIVDVAEEASLEIGPAGARPGFLGTAIVAGRATDILDTAYWLARGCDAGRMRIVEEKPHARTLQDAAPPLAA